MINKVILMGHLGADPELRHFENGSTLVTLSLATSFSYKDKAGEYVTKTEWHRLTAWGKFADMLAEHYVKGDLVYIEGRIEYNEYTDNDGNKRYATNIKILDAKRLSKARREAEPVDQDDEADNFGNKEFRGDGDDLPF